MEEEMKNIGKLTLPEVVGALSGVNAGSDSMQTVDDQGHRGALIGKPEETTTNNTLEVDPLLEAIEEVCASQTTKRPEEEVNPTIEQLKELVKLKGPGGCSFAKLFARRKKAIKTMERIHNNSGENSEAEIRSFNNAREIMEDREIEAFIETQIHYRNLLGIKPQTKEENEERHQANVLRKEAAAVKQKRKLSNPTVSSPKKQNANQGPSTSRDALREPNEVHPKPKQRTQSKPSTADASNKESVKKPKKNTDNKTEDLRMALVDIGNEDGKIDEETRSKVETSILLEMVKKGNSELYCEAGWSKGHRIFDCVSQDSVDFLNETVKNLNANEGKVMIIPMSKINTIRQPRGWIWIPKPYITSDLVLNLVKLQNPEYNTSNWSVATTGAKKVLGQHFLLKMNKEDVEKLKEKKMQLRVGFFTSDVKMDGEDLELASEEPMVTDADVESSSNQPPPQQTRQQ